MPILTDARNRFQRSFQGLYAETRHEAEWRLTPRLTTALRVVSYQCPEAASAVGSEDQGERNAREQGLAQRGGSATGACAGRHDAGRRGLRSLRHTGDA